MFSVRQITSNSAKFSSTEYYIKLFRRNKSGKIN